MCIYMHNSYILNESFLKLYMLAYYNMESYIELWHFNCNDITEILLKVALNKLC